ncbi:MAG: cohesin domain-containing protein [Bacteroidota bacterium]
MKQSILLTFFLVFVGLYAFTQDITVEIPTLTAPAIGQTIDVPVIISGADESGIPVSACDLNISYATSVLTYVGLVNFSPLAVSSEWVFNGVNGTVYANWAEPTYTTAVAFPDGTTLFYIRFTYNGGSSPLSFVKNEFYNAQYFLASTITVDGAVNAGATDKTLNLTGVMLESLYAGGGLLNQAFNDLGPQFDPGVADMITVELHDATNYSVVEHSAPVELSTTGTATVTGIPAALSGDYRITVKHRNSVETTTANAVSFAGTTITQSFGDPAEIYGGNLLLMIDMGYAIFGGDITQDGAVDGGDVTPFDNDQFNFGAGYVDTDVDGNGSVDSGDGTIIDNNQFNFVGAALP